jgi:predicted dehydrogenase
MQDHLARKFTRRRFIRNSAVAASALAVPAVVPRRVLGANETVQLAQIGCGGRGSNDLEALVAVPKSRVVAVCELRDDRLEKAKKIAYTSEPKGYKDFRKMIAEEKLDGVVAVVEVQNHAKVVVPILEAGINCFSEKPIDSTVEKVDQVVMAARKSKGFLQVGLQRRYIAGHRAVIDRIHKEELGKVYALQGHWHFSHPAGPADADWDGGRLIEQAVHHMDVMSWVMKNQAPTRCVAMGFGPSDPGANPPKHMSEAKSATTFEFPGNVLFSYTHFFGAAGPFGDEQGPNGLENNRNYTGEKLWVLCDKGGYDVTRGIKYVRGAGQEKVGEPSGGYYDGTNEQFLSFAECCRTGQKPASNHETARVSTLMSMLGRMAMYDRESATFTPRVVRWQDLGSKTDPTA